MTPVKPMLAEACKSIKAAIQKSPFGLYAEIKYDGERVQVHKNGNEFHFFSRNLKPVARHKVGLSFKLFVLIEMCGLDEVNCGLSINQTVEPNSSVALTRLLTHFRLH
jgi:hypothetical protein